MNKLSDSRRGFLKRTAYVAPAILTLAAAPSFAKPGSTKLDDWPKPTPWPKPKPKLPKIVKKLVKQLDD